MGLLQNLLIWTTDTFKPLGVWGLFILAFIEASVFPIPVDILLAILVLENPANTFLYATIAVIGSVLGGIFGYYIGRVGEHYILEKFIKKTTMKKYHTLFERYGAWAVFIAGFTPIPYKIAAIGSGVFYLNIKKFILACIFGRGLRFFSVAFIVKYFGESMLTFFDQNLLIFTILLIVGLLVYFFLKRKRF